jgi:hypothetical protein
MRDDRHDACVDEWLAQTAGLSSTDVLAAWERAFGALWQRTQRTLGEVTLTAILDRVLRKAARRYPLLSSLQAVTSGVSCKELATQAAEVPRDDLMESLRYVLVEFLTILGNLTAGIMNEPLQSTLAEQTRELAEAAAARTESTPESSPVHPTPSRKPSHV